MLLVDKYEILHWNIVHLPAFLKGSLLVPIMACCIICYIMYYVICMLGIASVFNNRKSAE